MKKIILTVAAIAILGVGILYWVTSNFSTKLLLCDKSNGSCETIAQFKNFETCERMNEKWGWFCDQTDPNKIACRVGEGVLAFSYCKK